MIKKYSFSGYIKLYLIAIILMVSFVTPIVSAVSYAFPTPYQLDYPGRIEVDGSQSYAFIGNNLNNVTEYFTFNTSDLTNGGLDYVASNRFYSTNNISFAVLDWANPPRMFIVLKNLDVVYTDSYGVIAEDGYYQDNVWPVPGCSNCNDLHKIGTLTSLNKKMSGFVDSEGNLYLGQGLSVVKFTRDSDYAKSTLITVSQYQESTVTGCQGAPCGYSISAEISDIKYSSTTGYFEVLVGSSATNTCGSCTQDLTVFVSKANYTSSGTYVASLNNIDTYIYDDAAPAQSADIYNASMVIATNGTYVFGAKSSNIKLRYYNHTSFSDICPTSCSLISDYDGLTIYNGYAYIASSSENKIYRFPTSVSVSSGSGYVVGSESITDGSGYFNYTSQDIESTYDTYHNNSDFRFEMNIQFSTNSTAIIDSGAVRWEVRLVDSNTTAQMPTYVIPLACTDTLPWWNFWADDSYFCENTGSKAFFVDPPVFGWVNGTYTVRMYEVLSGTAYLLDTDSVTVLNETGFTGISRPDQSSGSIVTSGTSAGSGADMINNMLLFMGMPIFWGMCFILLVIYALKNNTQLILPVIFIIINVEAVMGLLDPYKSYIVILTWLITAIFFIFVQRKGTG